MARLDLGRVVGATFTPQINEGILSWTNNAGLDNPTPVRVIGPEGPPGPAGQDTIIKINGAKVTEVDFTKDPQEQLNSKYEKPEEGIPESDLSVEVINKLNAEKGLIDIVKVNGEALPIEPTDKSVDINLSKYDNHISNTSNPHNVTVAQINAEPAFSKNSAFNKNFGTAKGTVCEGNDIRLSNARPASDVSAWAKAPKKPTYTKAEVGLGNVDNTADVNKPVSTAQAQAIDASLNKAKLYTDNALSEANFLTQSQLDPQLANKVDKEVGKGLSDNNFSNLDKTNLDANTKARHTHLNKDTLDKITEAFTAELKNEFESKYNKPSTGIPESDLSAELQLKINKVKIVEANPTEEATEDLTKIKIDSTIYQLPAGEITISDQKKENVDTIKSITINGTSYNIGGGYEKPSSGIPESDLSAELQAKIDSIGNINTVLESILGV